MSVCVCVCVVVTIQFHDSLSFSSLQLQCYCTVMEGSYMYTDSCMILELVYTLSTYHLQPDYYERMQYM